MHCYICGKHFHLDEPCGTDYYYRRMTTEHKFPVCSEKCYHELDAMVMDGEYNCGFCGGKIMYYDMRSWQNPTSFAFECKHCGWYVERD